jgi:hypothetical protein
MSAQSRASLQLALFFILIVSISLTACQADVPTLAPTAALLTSTETPAPTHTPASTNTLAAPAGVLWVDTTKDLGTISKYVLGANHGPWSDLGLGNIEPAKNSGITFLRWPGGSWGDHNDIRPNYITNYMGTARNIMAAEPSITVRLLGGTPEQAAALVKLVNIDKGYGVKYWAIGNEPDLYIVEDQTWTPEYFARRWREFALAMKAVDPSIILYGPDISNFVGDPGSFDPLELLYVGGVKQPFTKVDYLTEFLKVNADLVNIVTVHRYSFPLHSGDGLPTWEQLRDNTAQWDRVIPNLHRMIQEATGKDYPVGVVEFNSHTSNAIGGKTSPDSFYNALWLADILGRMIRQQPEMLAYWLLKNTEAGHGLMGSYDIRPTYYVYQLYKQFGNHLLFANTDMQYVSVFAAKTDDGAVTVILDNLNGAEVRKPLQLKGGEHLKLAQAFLFDASHKAEAITLPEFRNGDEMVLPTESVMLLVFR